MTEAARLAAWEALHDALGAMPGWRVTRPLRDPLDGSWRATVYDGSVRGRGVPRPALTASGATEAEAVARLAELVGDP